MVDTQKLLTTHVASMTTVGLVAVVGVLAPALAPRAAR
jgi:hypothetical protein